MEQLVARQAQYRVVHWNEQVSIASDGQSNPRRTGYDDRFKSLRHTNLEVAGSTPAPATREST